MPLPCVPEPEPPPRVAGKVLGFRCWALHGYRLLSANTALKAYWTIGVNKAECRRWKLEVARPASPSAHDAPAHDCACGLYAYHSPTFAIAGGDNVVFGAVLAWGRMEVHTAGFRAEYAEPVILAYHPAQPYQDVERIKAIGGEMGVQVVPVKELEAEALKHGSPVSEELRPPYDYGVVVRGNTVIGTMTSGGGVASRPPTPERRMDQSDFACWFGPSVLVNSVACVVMHEAWNLLAAILAAGIWAILASVRATR